MRGRDRVESKVLAEAGLAAMREAGKQVTRLPTKGRAMIYSLENGETVRVRTCNDHVLIVVADTPTPDARLNIEGTDWLLVVMPEKERTQGKIVAYLVPTEQVESEARRTHREWLAGDPNTKGDNKTWALWFRDDSSSPDNYSTIWAQYRLDSSVDAVGAAKTLDAAKPISIKAEVENARRKIAEVAGVPVEAVKVTINFEG